MRILIVEPDLACAEVVGSYFKHDSSSVYTTDLGEEALELLKLHQFDAMVTELTLKDLRGVQMLRRMRGEKILTPVLVLSNVNSRVERVAALHAGADDFLVKPCHSDELLARTMAIVRRSSGYAGSQFVFGDLELDVESRSLKVRGAAVHATRKEFKILRLLFLRRGSMVTKSSISGWLYGGIDETDDRTIHAYVYRLRRKMAEVSRCEEYPHGRLYIGTHSGEGFKLLSPNEVRPFVPFRTVSQLPAVAAE
jgi:two-component system, cell cycle response regulator CtrA